MTPTRCAHSGWHEDFPDERNHFTYDDFDDDGVHTISDFAYANEVTGPVTYALVATDLAGNESEPVVVVVETNAEIAEIAEGCANATQTSAPYGAFGLVLLAWRSRRATSKFGVSKAVAVCT